MKIHKDLSFSSISHTENGENIVFMHLINCQRKRLVTYFDGEEKIGFYLLTHLGFSGVFHAEDKLFLVTRYQLSVTDTEYATTERAYES